MAHLSQCYVQTQVYIVRNIYCIYGIIDKFNV